MTALMLAYVIGGPDGTVVQQPTSTTPTAPPARLAPTS